MAQSASTARPQGLGRGWHPKASGYKQVTYQTVSVDRADQAWRALAATRRGRIQVMSVLAATMGVSERTARRLVRLYDALELLDYIPGHWNRERWSNLGGFDLNRQSENVPAEVRMRHADTEAFFGALHPRAEVVGIYVASLVLPSACRHVQSNTISASLREGERARPSPFWWSKRAGRGGLGPFFSLEVPDTTTYKGGSTFDEKNEWLPIAAPPSVVLTRRLTPAREARNDWCSTSLKLVRDEPQSVSDLMAQWGVSQATAYREIKALLARGAATKVKANAYLLH